MPNIITFRVDLIGTKPPIWRKIEVDDSMTFEELHLVIQDAMGWFNAHLYGFYFGRHMSIECNLEGVRNCGSNFDQSYLASKVKLSNFIKKIGYKFVYVYDFGDDWDMLLTVKAIVPKKRGQRRAFFVSGKKNAPPEDCGGVWGYYNLLEILKNKEHSDYEMWAEWIGGDFDPEYFNHEEINKRLEKFDKSKKSKNGGRQRMWILNPKKSKRKVK